MLAAVRPILARRNPPLLPPRVTSAVRPSLPQDADRVALDRRAGPRRSDRPPLFDRFTAASHRDLPLVLGLGVAGRWALVKGLSLGPSGVLVHLIDSLDPELDPRDRIGAHVWMRLARCVSPTRVPSPLWLSTCCVQAPALVAELARRASSQAATTVDLVVLASRASPCAPPPLRCSGMLAPLCDPSPQVLGIALGDPDLAMLVSLFAAPAATAPPATAAAPTPPIPIADDAPARNPRANKPRRRQRRAKAAVPAA
jgi:hypothetical protein